MDIGIAANKLKALRGALSVTERDMLLNSPLVSGLSAQLQCELIERGCYTSHKRGEFLFMDNDTIDHVYYLLSGKAREYYCTGDGSDCLRCLHSPGSYISLHMAMSQEQIYPYSCEILRSASFYTWKVSDLKQIVSEESELSHKMLLLLSSYVEASCRKICLCRKSQAVSRVAAYLLSLDKGNQVGCPCYASLTANKTSANIRPVNFSANDVCLARETFSRALTLLKDKNLVNIDQGYVNILDVEGLKRVSEGS